MRSFTTQSHQIYTAMQLLNSYVAKLTQGEHINAARVTFWVREGDSLSKVEADLPAYGSLGPLFHAFGLISAEELQNGSGVYIPGELHTFTSLKQLYWNYWHFCIISLHADQSDTDFMEWLRSTLTDALRAASQHESLKKVIRGLRASIEGRFGLAGVQVRGSASHLALLWAGECVSAQRLRMASLPQVGSEFAISTIEQQLHIKALRTLNACLTALTVDAPQKFEGAPVASLPTALQPLHC